MDCTISMGPHIQNAIVQICAIVDEIASEERITARFALIEYRDHPPQVSASVQSA
jgi:hypothetical protein